MRDAFVTADDDTTAAYRATKSTIGETLKATFAKNPGVTIQTIAKGAGIFLLGYDFTINMLKSNANKALASGYTNAPNTCLYMSNDPYLGLYGCNNDVGALGFGVPVATCFIPHGGRGYTIGFSRTEEANAIKMHVFGGVRFQLSPDLPYSTNAALGKSLNNAFSILLVIGERGYASLGELNALCRDAYNKTDCFRTTKITVAKHHLWYKSDFGSLNTAYLTTVHVHAAAKNITTTGIHNIKAKLLPATAVGVSVATRDEEITKTFVPASDMGASGNIADDPSIKPISTSKSLSVVLDIEVGRYSMDDDIKTYPTAGALLLAFDNIASVSNWVLPYALVGAISELCHA